MKDNTAMIIKTLIINFTFLECPTINVFVSSLSIPNERDGLLTQFDLEFSKCSPSLI